MVFDVLEAERRGDGLTHGECGSRSWRGRARVVAPSPRSYPTCQQAFLAAVTAAWRLGRRYQAGSTLTEEFTAESKPRRGWAQLGEMRSINVRRKYNGGERETGTREDGELTMAGVSARFAAAGAGATEQVDEKLEVTERGLPRVQGCSGAPSLDDALRKGATVFGTALETPQNWNSSCQMIGWLIKARKLMRHPSNGRELGK